MIDAELPGLAILRREDRARRINWPWLSFIAAGLLWLLITVAILNCSLAALVVAGDLIVWGAAIHRLGAWAQRLTNQREKT